MPAGDLMPWGPDNPFCNEISRHEADGQIYQIMNRQYNLDSGKARGVDVAMDYVWDFTTKGDLTFKLDWTHVLEDSYTYEGLDGLVKVDWAKFMRLYAGVRNIFNDKGPFIPTGGDTFASGPGNFDSPYGGGVGRYAFAGIEVGFE